MFKPSTKPVLAVGAALLLAGTAAFSTIAEAQRGDGPGGGAPGARGGPSGGGGPSVKGGGGGGGSVKGPSTTFKGPGPGGGKGPPPSGGKGPGPGGGKSPPPGGGKGPGGWGKGPGGFPPPPPPRRPRPPGVSFWYWSGIPIYATDYDGCGYEYYKWRSTGSSYWRQKFYQCRDDED